MSNIVNCPTCGKPVTWDADSKWRPFCSERCRLIDLGEWANESFRISADDADDTDTVNRPEPDDT
jgi:endogenous inhibitor of DNA gyrase (YacG/DUF329 family)